MERVFRLTADLACVGQYGKLPNGSLVLEPRLVGQDEIGADWVFLASRDGGETWREYATVLEDASEWFELLSPAAHPLGDGRTQKQRPEEALKARWC